MKKTFLECARKYLGYKQQELAKICFMTRQRYASLEKGDIFLRFGEVERVFYTLKRLKPKYCPFSWTYDYPSGFSIESIQNCHLEDLLNEIEI